VNAFEFYKGRNDEPRPSAAEIEQRKQARTGLRVERAVNQPGGRPVAVSAPAAGAKEQ
jgi:hypothetical protein